MILKQLHTLILRYGPLSISALVGLFLLFILSIYLGAWGRLPNKKALSDFKYQKATEVFSADTVLIGKYYLYDRQPIEYEDIPQNLIDALVAIEDERFYQHSGVDFRSLIRVAIKTVLLQDQSAGGGSTISQQLAKNLYPREEGGSLRLVANKIKEMIIARRLEHVYSKKEVLQHYLNTVSFGDNTFGIESAALKFFNKRARDLKIEESATLVGMLKATYGYNPRINPENSLSRRNLVLSAMKNNKFLKESVKDSLTALALELDYREYDYSAGLAPYFREEIRKQLIRWNATQKEAGLDYNIYTSGLKVYTTLDYKMQLLAEKAMEAHMATLQESFEKSYGTKAPWNINEALIGKIVRNSVPYKKLIQQGLNEQEAMDSLNHKKSMTLLSWEGNEAVQASTLDSIRHYMKFLNTGSLSVDPHSGGVKTWIGGVNYKYFKYDHISQSKRQVGSAFKPIVYTAALESGIDPCTYFSAEEVEYKNLEGWSPSNSGDKEEDYLNYSMEEALSNSVNTVAVKVLEKTGIPRVIEQAKKMGITAPLPRLPSLALGTGAISLEELAGAYCSYVNNGVPVRPFVIRYITDSKDSILQTFTPDLPSQPAFTKENGMITLEMMKATINSGTAERIRTVYGLKNDIAGKTGTTQNNKDAWFVAVTPNLVHVTWVGLDHHEIGFKSTSLGQGANAALPLFAKLYQDMIKDPEFDPITRARFNPPDQAVLDKLDCEPVKRDGFFKRLFKNPKKKKSREFDDGV